ncbi:MAG: gamma carbonic anhydrase family protein [Candidatus Omnitrophica bacterium]|nr:gamma carbonic anhydrase family protein [Candidatus Omnitrophota bacterium]
MPRSPSIHGSAFVHSSAVLIGDVSVGEHASVWPCTVLRGDINSIKIGRYTNIQDLTLVHVDRDAPCTVGDYVVCGHQVTLHGCTIGNDTLIGIGAIVLSHAVVGSHVVLGAHALVPEGKVLEDGFVYFGSPAKKIRPVTEEDKKRIREGAEVYVALAKRYANWEFAEE